ncbi:MAG: TIGR01777 family oxidoreductase, partial [Planctomycetota bacterium]
MRVIITGATGFIGTALCRELHKDHELIALSRNADKAKQALGSMATVTQWNAKTLDGWEETVNSASVVINLSGENIASGRWTKSKKTKILRSRLDATKAIVEAIKQADNKPQLLVQPSAIGYYGDRGDEILDENYPTGTGFLADVCRQWERTIQPLENSGIRLITIRLGPVLGTEGGMIPKVLPAFRFFLGGHPGSGKQWLSWVHIDDVITAIRFLIENTDSQGVFNLTSPNPILAKNFYDLL